MKRFKMLLLAILSVTMVMAQEMKVAGTLVDRDTKEGVLMATVQLLKSDSTFVKEFSLMTPAISAFPLKVPANTYCASRVWATIL